MNSSHTPLPTLSPREKIWGIRYLLFQICFLSSLLHLANGLLPHPLSVAMLNFLYFAVNAIATCCIFSGFLKKNCLRALHYWQQTLLFALLGFGIYWACSSLLSVAIHACFPSYVNLNDGHVLEMVGSEPTFMAIATVLLAPVAEEVMHRGLIFGSLRSRSIPAAYILSALLFALIHVSSYIGVYSVGHFALALLQYLPAGLVFAWCYARSGSILTPILIHTLNNAVVLFTSR